MHYLTGNLTVVHKVRVTGHGLYSEHLVLLGICKVEKDDVGNYEAHHEAFQNVVKQSGSWYRL